MLTPALLHSLPLSPFLLFNYFFIPSFVCACRVNTSTHTGATHTGAQRSTNTRVRCLFSSLFSLLWRSTFLGFSTRRLPFLLFCVYAASTLIGFTLRYVSADSFGNRHCFPFQNQPSPGKAGWRMIICRKNRVRIFSPRKYMRLSEGKFLLEKYI